jgi:hypothetical protein
MQTHELLDRFEILYPTKSALADLRRAVIDKDLSSVFRLLPETITGNTDELRKAVLEKNVHSIFRLADDDELRKLILEENIWKLWPVLDRYVETHFVDAFKNFYINETKIDDDCFSRGQLESKIWLTKELKKTINDLGTVFLCAGWYATLSTMLFEKGFRIEKLRSFDLDPSCVPIAKIFNKPWLKDDWKFQASTADILDIDYDTHTFTVNRADGTECELTDIPNTIINTSCEHIKDFSKWFSKIPQGKLVVLQSNNYFEIEEHVNCVNSIDEFVSSAPMRHVMYSGELQLPKYKRFMVIGYV